MKFCQVKAVISTLVALSIANATATAQPKFRISEESLLSEMTDRDNMARLPLPAYTTSQFSSYDRASVVKDGPGWYANGDFSAYLRAEEVNGHTEFVMLDAEGPGAIVRFWMTLAGGENGTVRIYIDGSETPAVEAATFDLLGTDVIAGNPMSASVSPLTPREQRGHDLYYPIPYAKSCKITYQKSTTGNGSVYYNIECRNYGSDVDVVSFRGKADKKLEPLVKKTNATLAANPTFNKKKSQKFQASLSPAENKSLTLKGSSAIECIRIKVKADNLPQALRSTVISMNFDGEDCVWAPVGDFFATGYTPMHQRTFFNNAEEDGSLECYWIMPFEKECELTLRNLSDQQVDLDCEVFTKAWKWDSRSMHFGACWQQLYDAKTGTYGLANPKDVNFVTLTGKGKYLGDVLTLFNTSGSWWGEGDEKVYVDGETFPSHLGTGTEDYYGYAWCAPGVFSDHPFIGLPIGSGNLGIGRTVNIRYRSLDAITFEKSLDFNLELYEWDDERIVYAPTSFWYMLPGGTCNIQPNVKEAARKVVMERSDFIKNTLTSVIEGEDMKVLSCDAKYEIQYMGHTPWAYKTILFMKGAVKGNRITATFESPYEATVRADVIFAIAKDYGTVNLYFNGEKVISGEDLSYYEISSKTVPAGEILLKKGTNTVILEIEEVGNGYKKAVAGIDRIVFYPL